MATSSTYTLTITGQQMATDILRVVGAIEYDESADSDQTPIVLRATNFWLLQKKSGPHSLNPGQKMWTRETIDLTLTATAEYDLKPSGGDADIQIPVEILTATLKDTDGNETPLDPMNLEEWQSISLKTQVGTPGRYYYERRLDTGKFRLDYVPSDITDVIDIVYRQPLELVTNGAHEFDVDNSWYRAIKYNVALDVAPEFSQTDPNRISQIQRLATDAMIGIGAFEPEESNAFFEPGRD